MLLITLLCKHRRWMWGAAALQGSRDGCGLILLAWGEREGLEPFAVV